MELYDVTIKRFPDGTIRYSANYISNFFDRSIYTDDLVNHKSDPNRSLKVSYNRTVSHVADLIHANEWDWFFTLTFDERKVDRYNYEKCSDLVHHFTDLLYRAGARYIIVPEKHKDGAWHFHGLLKDLSFDELYTNSNGYLSFKRYKYGFTSLDPVRDTHRAGTYILKYLVKGYNYIDIPKGKKRYWASRKLDKPIIEYDIIDVSELDNLRSKAYYERKIDMDFFSGWIFEILDNGKRKETSEDN